ncbi:MAG: hypothetical protein WCQ75_03490 [Bacilli bacterium]
MKKKLRKIMFLIGFFLVSFFISQNVFAYTEIVSENFDSYNLDDGLDGKNGFYKGPYLDTLISNDVFSSSPYSLKMGMHANYRFYRDLTNDYTGLEEVYIEQDVYFLDGSSIAMSFDNYNFQCGINFSYYDGLYFYSNASETMTIIDNDPNCSSSYYCQNWFNFGLHLFLDKTINTLYFSVYIDNVLIGTYIKTDYTSNLNTLEEFGNYSNVPVYIDNFVISSSIPSSSIDGVCGSANSSTFDWADFDNQDFCSAGDFYLSGDNGERIVYACTGLNGGTTQYNCSANYYYNGACGSASGSSFSSLDISNTDLCSSGYVSESSFLESGSGWTWICSGSGSSSFCNASKSLISFPEMPEETDCSSLTFPDNLLCNIENLLKTGFLPSASALNNLNNAVNQVQQKAPFNYLNVAIEKISGIKDNITSESISMSLMGNSSTLNINSFTSDFMPSVKSFFTLMIVFGFIFWGIAYIKHFFK